MFGMTDIGRKLLWIAAVTLVLNLLALAAPLYVIQVYDRVIRSQNEAGAAALDAAVAMLCLAAALAYGALALLETMRRRMLAGVGDVLADRFGAALLRRATAPVTSHSSRPAVALIGHDLDIMHRFARSPALAAFLDLPFAPLFLLVLAGLHWGLGLAGVVCVSGQTVLLVLTAHAAAQNHKTAGLDQTSNAAADAHVFGDAVTRHADCAGTMGLSDALAARWQRLRGAMLAGENAAGRRSLRLRTAARWFCLTAPLLILAFAACLVRQHVIGDGAVFASFLLAGRALAPVESVTASWRMALAARAAFARLRASDARPVAPARPVVERARGELVLEGVAWTPSGAVRPALRGITLKIEAGAALAVIGPSAAGKSSLARVLCGALHPSHGCVRLDGVELDRWNDTQRGAAVGYLPQDVALFPGTIAENIARFGSATEFEIVAAARLAGAHDMIRQLPAGYGTMVEETGASLSAGQRQRVALARALLGDPPVLVLDEPNASLDAEGEAALIGCMIEARRRRRTVVMITHNTGLVRVADFVATMVGGHVMKVQRTAEVLGRPSMLAATG